MKLYKYVTEFLLLVINPMSHKSKDAAYNRVENMYHERSIFMNRTVIVLSSVTYALKAQKVLIENGISGILEKLSADRTGKGCGYGVKIASANLERAVEILRKNRIRVMATLDEP